MTRSARLRVVGWPRSTAATLLPCTGLLSPETIHHAPSCRSRRVVCERRRKVLQSQTAKSLNGYIQRNHFRPKFWRCRFRLTSLAEAVPKSRTRKTNTSDIVSYGIRNHISDSLIQAFTSHNLNPHRSESYSLRSRSRMEMLAAAREFMLRGRGVLPGQSVEYWRCQNR